MPQTAFEKYAAGSKLKNVELPGNTSIRIDSLLDFADFSDGDWHRIRLWPGIHGLATMWLDVKNRDGQIVQIPRTFLNYDIEKATFDSTKRCPYYENQDRVTCRGEQGGQVNIHYYINVLDRELQNSEPKKTKMTDAEKESGFKTKDSKSWTPIRVARFPKTVIEKIIKLEDLNRVDGEQRELSDPNHGRDIYVMYNKSASSPANMWDVQIDPDGPSKLTKKEREYLMYPVEEALRTMQTQQTLEDAIRWMDTYFERMGGKSASSPKKGKKDKVKKDSKSETKVDVKQIDGKKGKKKVDTESDVPPWESTKKKKKKASPPASEDSGNVAPKKKAKKPKVSEPEPAPETPPKKKAKKAKVATPAPEPAPKKKKKSADVNVADALNDLAAPKKKKKKAKASAEDTPTQPAPSSDGGKKKKKKKTFNF